MTEDGDTKTKTRKVRTMNLCLVREVTAEEAGVFPATADEAGPQGKLFEIVADEEQALRDEKDVENWMDDEEFKGELFVLAFRRGHGKREGKNGRMRRRRFKPEAFVVE